MNFKSGQRFRFDQIQLSSICTERRHRRVYDCGVLLLYYWCCTFTCNHYQWMYVAVCKDCTQMCVRACVPILKLLWTSTSMCVGLCRSCVRVYMIVFVWDWVKERCYGSSSISSLLSGPWATQLPQSASAPPSPECRIRYTQHRHILFQLTADLASFNVSPKVA